MQYRIDEAKPGQSVFSQKSERRKQMRSIRNHTHTSSFITSPRASSSPYASPDWLGIDAIVSFVVFQIYTLPSEAAAQPDDIADAVGVAWASQRARKADRVVALPILSFFPLYRQPTTPWPSSSGCGTYLAISRSRSAGLLLRLPSVATHAKCLVGDEAPLSAPGC